MIPFTPHLDGYHDVADQMIRNIRDRAEAALAAQTERKRELTTLSAFEAHRRRVRERFLAAIGGLPVAEGEARPPLQEQVTGTRDRGDFTIEKLLYQSLPDFYVTANLYLPKRLSSPAPAVLLVCGHHDSAKAAAEYQWICIDLVRAGFVVMAMDPPGQGERWQYWETETGRRLTAGGCTTEHTYAGIPAMLLGTSIARYFLWDAIRAVDYLCSRPEVDPERIGVTGNSGGGLQSSFLMLAEPRLAAAIPCTFIMTLESYLATGQAQDSEQLVAGCFVDGPDHDDYLTAMAPKPVLVGAAAYDFFPIEGTLEAVARAKRIYRLYGREENVAVAVAPTRHEYSKHLREAAVGWFSKHLRPEERPVSAPAPEPLPEAELNVTPTGQVLDLLPSSKTLFHLNRERMLERKPSPPHEAEALRREIREALGIADLPTGAPVYPRVIAERVIEGYPLEKLLFFSEPGMCVAGVVIHPRGNAPAVGTDLLLLEDGTAAMERERPRIEALLRRGRRVFVFDPRGVGAVASRPISGGHPHGFEWRLGCDAMMLGTSTLGLRVFDVLRAYDYLVQRPDTAPNSIGLHGVDSGATWAWYAAALEPGFSSVTVENLLYSYRNLVGERFYDSHLYGLRTLAYGLLSRFDLPDLLSALAPRPVRVLSPRDCNGEPVSASLYWQRVIAEQRAAGRLPDGWEPEVGEPQS